MQIYTSKDADLSLIQQSKIALFGYGNQGRAHALNLRDSGLNIAVSVPSESRSFFKAKEDGFEVYPAKEAALCSSIISMLAPDEKHLEIFTTQIGISALENKTVVFAHGFNVAYRVVEFPSSTDVVLVAPKGPGYVVREDFIKGRGTPALLAVHHDASGMALKKAVAYAEAIGCARAGLLETTFKDETHTDLFGEQVVLCGGVTELIRAAFETLVSSGYPPELAWFECLYELKLTVDLIHSGGISYMQNNISGTALFGSLTRGCRVVDERVKAHMKSILKEISSGKFASEWLSEHSRGKPLLKSLKQRAATHLIEKTGEKLMKVIPRLSPRSTKGNYPGGDALNRAVERGSQNPKPNGGKS